jgi:hypothetical protein
VQLQVLQQSSSRLQLAADLLPRLLAGSLLMLLQQQVLSSLAVP